ncbi:hypothetical protein KTQ42_10230|nr:hypothetical protein [Noviherbaspirillum sp. L7-7A]MBV0879677.1 hypothetical protein [Noviherbaspirillum sp. L7-7A]
MSSRIAASISGLRRFSTGALESREVQGVADLADGERGEDDPDAGA